MNTRAKIDVLSNSTFASLPEHAREILAQMLWVESFDEGQDLCVEGEPADAVFVIVEGQVLIQAGVPPHVITRLRSGAVVGEMGVFASGIRTATVRAIEHTIVLSLDYSRFRSFLLRYPEALWSLCELAVQRLVELH